MLINSRLIPFIPFLLLILPSSSETTFGEEDEGSAGHQLDNNAYTRIKRQEAIDLPDNVFDDLRDIIWSRFEVAARDVIAKHSSDIFDDYELPSLDFLLLDQDSSSVYTKLSQEGSDVTVNGSPASTLTHGLIPLVLENLINREIEDKVISNNQDIVKQAMTDNEVVTWFNTTFLSNVASLKKLEADFNTSYEYVHVLQTTEQEISRLHMRTNRQKRLFSGLLQELDQTILTDVDQKISNLNLDSINFMADMIDVNELYAEDVTIDHISGEKTDDLLEYIDENRLVIGQDSNLILEDIKRFEQKVTVFGDVKTSEINSMDLSDAVETKNLNDVSSALNFVSDTVDVSDLNLPQYQVDDMIFIDKSQEVVIPVELEFEEMVISDLTMESGLLDDFDLRETYFLSEGHQEVEGLLSFEGNVLMNSTKPDIFLLNNQSLDKALVDFVLLEEGIKLDNLTLEDVFIADNETGELVVSSVNEVSIPEDIMFINGSDNMYSNVISANHSLGNVTFEDVEVNGLLDSVPLSEVVSLSKEEDIAGRISFTEGIFVDGNITLEGNLCGSDIVYLANEHNKIYQEFDVIEEVKSRNISRDVIIMGNMFLTDNSFINDIDLKVISKDVVIRNESAPGLSEEIKIAGTKTFGRIERAFQCFMNEINGVKFADIVTTSGHDTIRSSLVFGNITLTDLHTNPFLDKNPLGLIHRVAQHHLLQSRNDNSFNELTVETIDAQGLVNDIKVSSMDLVMKSHSSEILEQKVITSDIVANKLKTGSLKFIGSLSGVTQDVIDNRIDLNNEQFLSSILIEDSTAEAMNIESNVLDTNLTEFLGNILLQRGKQTITGPKTFIEADSEDVIESKTGLIPRHLQLNKDNEITKIIFEDDLTVNSATFSSFKKINLDKLAFETFKKIGEQEVTGDITFDRGFSTKDFEADNIQGEDDYEVKTGNEWNVFINSPALNEQVIKEDLFLPSATFKKTNINTEGVDVSGYYSIPDSLFASLPNCSSPDMPDGSTLFIASDGTVFMDDLKPKKFFNLDWKRQVKDIVRTSNSREISLLSKTFSGVLNFRGSVISDSLRANRIRNKTLRSWSLLPNSNFDGIITFLDNVTLHSANFMSNVNDMKLEAVTEHDRRDLPNTRPEEVRRPQPNYDRDSFGILTVPSIHVRKTINDIPMTDFFVSIGEDIDLEGNISIAEDSVIDTDFLDVTGDIKTTCGASCLIGSDHMRHLDGIISEMEKSVETYRLSGDYKIIQELQLPSFLVESKRLNKTTFIRVETEVIHGRRSCRLGRVFQFNPNVPLNKSVLLPVNNQGIFSQNFRCLDPDSPQILVSSRLSSPHPVTDEKIKRTLLNFGINGIALLDSPEISLFNRRVIISSSLGTEALEFDDLSGEFKTLQRLPFKSHRVQALSETSFILLVNEDGYDRLVVFKLDQMLSLFIEDQSLEFSGSVRDFQLFSFGNNKYLIVLLEEKLQLFTFEGGSFIPRPPQRLIECGHINGLNVFVHENMVVCVISGKKTTIMKLVTEETDSWSLA